MSRILSLRDHTQKSTTNFAPELASPEHQFSFELPGGSRVQQVILNDSFHLPYELRLPFSFDLQHHVHQVVGDPEHSWRSSELELLLIKRPLQATSERAVHTDEQMPPTP